MGVVQPQSCHAGLLGKTTTRCIFQLKLTSTRTPTINHLCYNVIQLKPRNGNGGIIYIGINQGGKTSAGTIIGRYLYVNIYVEKVPLVYRYSELFFIPLR